MTKRIREAFTCNSSIDNENDEKCFHSPDDTGTEMKSDILQNKTENANAIVKGLTIQLTPEEEQLFQTLENAAIAYETKTLSDVDSNNSNNSNDGGGSKSKKEGNGANSADIVMPNPPPERVEIRVAGGWVRDKILNQSSHDVDIALDTMSGLQFASVVQRYLLQQQQQNTSNESGEGNQSSQKSNKKQSKTKAPKIAVIAANPNQSKHLETATMKIHSIDVDFVHLRGGEVYTSDSRIPTLKENATPLDDALRRDFTVNSLFYNLRKRHVEDYTGRGIPDLLRSKMLVTPIDANLTFHDDPLRVLRAIRFGVRYDLTLSDEIVDAARSKEVHDSLHVKVSRERVGKELEGMLSGKNAKPKVALMVMTNLKLAGCVFCFPPEGTHMEGKIQAGVDDADDDNIGTIEYSQFANDSDGAAHAREIGWEESALLLKYTSPLLQAFKDRFNDDAIVSSSKINIRLFYLSTFLHPFHWLTYLDKKKKTISLITYMIKESIKFSNNDVKSITTLMENIDEMKSILHEYYNHHHAIGDGNDQNDQPSSAVTSSASFSRLRIGMTIRRLKDMWITALLVAAVIAIRSNNVNSMEDGSGDNDAPIMCKTINVVLDLIQDIFDQNLDECWKIRPLLDGKAMVKSLDLPKGPLVGVYMEAQVKWMLVNPNGTKVECEQHLLSMRKKEIEASSSDGGNATAKSV